MNVHVLQHVPFEGLGSMEPWLRTRGARITCTRFFEETALPPLDDIDLLIALGGPMSVNDEARLPWLRAEKQFLAQAIASGIPTLGICLGAQLIASALGAPVTPNPQREIGWFPLEAISSATPPPVTIPADAPVFHWHGETFALPPGAVCFARSAACAHQAFHRGSYVVGLQFHLETTPASADALLEHCADELNPVLWVQSAEEIRAAPPENYSRINRLMEQLLEHLLVV